MSNPPELAGDELIRALRNEIGDLDTQIKGLKETIGENNANMIALIEGVYRAVKGENYRDFMKPHMEPANHMERAAQRADIRQYDKGKKLDENIEEEIKAWELPPTETPERPKIGWRFPPPPPPPEETGESSKKPKTEPPAAPSTQRVTPATPPTPPTPTPTTAPSKPPKIGTEPEKYDGKEKGVRAKNWLRKVFMYCKMNEYYYDTEEKTVMFAVGLLKDAAEAWAAPITEAFMEDDPTCDALHDTEEFEGAFIKAFGDPDAKRAAERKIQDLTQGNRKASEYVTDFETLRYEIGPSWGEAFFSHFRKGLRPEILTILASQPPLLQPKNLASLQEFAVTMDNQLRELEASQKKTGGVKKSDQPKSTGRTRSGEVPKEGDPNWVSKEEIERRKAAGLCIKCAEKGHRAWKCRNGWRAAESPSESKEEKKEEKTKPKKASVARVEEVEESEKE
ncbi:Retrotransposon-derived protein PEG10 [Rhizoctonia solani]|uniref:Retrotransposon-derived protein PEG10 n=1 Tax=Rhizoctonia solani TaxID=456999 RepID=A0A0K6GFE0_9AGAM|nr:Retrotransposon-derived protein PEG10 [Rhizoctonia solani]